MSKVSLQAFVLPLLHIEEIRNRILSSCTCHNSVRNYLPNSSKLSMEPDCSALNHTWVAPFRVKENVWHAISPGKLWSVMWDLNVSRCSTGYLDPLYISTSGTLNFDESGIAMNSTLHGRSVLVSNWSTDEDAPIFQAISSCLSMRLRKLCIFLFSLLLLRGLFMLCDFAFALSTWLGTASSPEVTFLCFRTSFSSWRASISIFILLGLSSISASVSCMFKEVASKSCVAWERVVVGMWKAYWNAEISQMAPTIVDVFCTPITPLMNLHQKNQRRPEGY